MKGHWRSIVVWGIALLAISVPFLYAFQLNGPDGIFGGFLLNPIDGHSYLAKMQQGYRGEWKFTLPYTAEPGSGAYLFFMYIGLGHLARIFNVPLIMLFHAARIIGSIFLLFSLKRFIKYIFDDKQVQFYAFVLLVFGSGVGWLAVTAGTFTSDFWVAEAYPFLAMYTNVHFPISLGLMLAALYTSRDVFWKTTLIGLGLAIIQPFSIVILSIVFGIMVILEYSAQAKKEIKEVLSSMYVQKFLGLLLFGAPVLLYQYWRIISDPILSIWNAQNQTPTPSVLDLLISFSPVVVISVFGFKRAWKSNSGRLILAWAVSSILLIYVPWNLSRRFLTGMFIPLGILSVFGLQSITSYINQSLRIWFLVVLVLSIPTNLIVILSAIQAAEIYDENIYYSSDLNDCMTWIKDNTRENVLIMADAKTGLLIPSNTGRRVLYGHPFETARAEQELRFVEDYYSNLRQGIAGIDGLIKRDINYLLVSAQDSRYLDAIANEGVRSVFQSSSISLYKLSNQ